jgi:hypothetical protein
MKNYKKLQQLFDNVTFGTYIEYIGYNKHESSPNTNIVYTDEEIIISFNSRLGTECIKLRCKKRENDYPLVSFEDYELNKKTKKPNCFYAIFDDMLGAEVLGNECSFTKISIQTLTNIITISPDNKINGFGFVIEAEIDVQGDIINNDKTNNFNKSESLIELSNDLKKYVGSKLIILKTSLNELIISNEEVSNKIEFILCSKKNVLKKHTLTFKDTADYRNFSYLLKEKKISSSISDTSLLQEKKNLSSVHFLNEEILDVEIYNFTFTKRNCLQVNDSLSILIYTSNYIATLSFLLVKSDVTRNKVSVSVFTNNNDSKNIIKQLKKQLVDFVADNYTPPILQ